MLTRHIQANPNKNLAIDLAAVKFMDSSGINLLVNLNKRLSGEKRKLFLVGPNDQIAETLTTLKLDKVFSVVRDHQELDNHTTAQMYHAYLPHTRTEGELKRLNCSCPVCGSNVVSGYLIDRQAYGWRWDDTRLFPTSFNRETGKQVDIDALQPIICLDCYLSFIDVSLFDIMEGDQPAIPSRLKPREKQLLQKTLKKRKDIMDIGVVVGDTFFDPPRTAAACHLAYLLAAGTARAIAEYGVHASTHAVMWLQCLALKYAPQTKKSEQRENCRAWVARVLGSGAPLTPLQRTQANYMLMNICLEMGKTKDAQNAYEALKAVEQSLPPNEPTSIGEPRFWLAQGHNIWQQHSNSA
jgi:anti-anti-sigma factor